MSVSAPKRNTHVSRTRRQGMLYVAPSLVAMFGVSIVPVFFLVATSLFNYTRGNPLSSAVFIGLENYTRLLTGRDDNFWPAVGVTIAFLVAATLTTAILGTILAIFFDNMTRGQTVFTTLLLVPLVMAPVIAGLIWRLMFNDLYGVINGILRPFGLDQAWLGSGPLAFLSVVIVETWQWTPFVALIMFAGLRSIDPRPREAAMIDGAGPFQTLRYVTFPMVAPFFGLVIALRVIDSMKIFDTIYMLTQGGPGKATETLGLMVWHYGLYQTGWIGRASAVAVLLLVLVLVLSNLVMRYLKRVEMQESQ